MIAVVSVLLSDLGFVIVSVAFELDHQWPLLCFAGIKEDVDYIYIYV